MSLESCNNVQAITIDRVRTASSRDNDLINLIKYIINGFPLEKHEMPEELQRYWNVRHDLSVLNNIVLYNRRIVIPSELRHEVLDVLHSANQGTTGMKARATKIVYWPGLNQAIANRRERCRDCTTIAPSNNKEPMIMTSSSYPFEKVVVDYFCMKGFKYLIHADRYSGWPSVVKIKPGEGDSKFLKGILNNLFALFGVPNELSSDGGSPFNSFDFQKYMQNWGITWRNSSAYYAQSNGRAEIAVKTAKRILISNCDEKGDIDNMRFARALLQYRNTPLQGIDLSPAQILYGRELKDCMPTLEDALIIRKEWRIAADQRERALMKRHIRSIEKYNEHSRNLPELNVHDCVAVQNQTGSHPTRWDKTGIIVEKLAFRQYKVLMDGSRRVTLRNRKFLRKINPVCAEPSLPTLTPQRYNTKSNTSTRESADESISPTTPDADQQSVVEQPPLHQYSIIPPSQSPVTPETGHVELRRSTRDRTKRSVFQAQLRGKSHSESTQQ